jgi:hypothetical protein
LYMRHPSTLPVAGGPPNPYNRLVHLAEICCMLNSITGGLTNHYSNLKDEYMAMSLEVKKTFYKNTKANQDRIITHSAELVADFRSMVDNDFTIMLIRPNIEHNMLGVMMGRGGVEDLGATFWGQTELSVYDDGMHGKWGMSYKYHERAMVLNERNLIRHWDVAFNGYNGGYDDVFVDWGWHDPAFGEATNDLSKPYDGPSIMGLVMPRYTGSFPNPILLSHGAPHTQMTNMDPEGFNSVYDERMAVFSNDSAWAQRYALYSAQQNFPNFEMLHATRKPAGTNSHESVTEVTSVAFQGTIHVDHEGNNSWEHTRGAGHLGDSYVGVASVREGKGFRQEGVPSFTRAV